MTRAVKILLSGEIGSGKSTAVRAALERLGWEAPGGFFTHWDGQSRGASHLYFETWEGERHEMARRLPAACDSARPPYALDQANFTKRAVASLSAAASGRPVVIDELGLMELDAAGFPEAVAELFRGRAPVLAVIQRRALDRWLAILGRENIDEVLETDAATRATLPGRIAGRFRG